MPPDDCNDDKWLRIRCLELARDVMTWRGGGSYSYAASGTITYIPAETINHDELFKLAKRIVNFVNEDF